MHSATNDLPPRGDDAAPDNQPMPASDHTADAAANRPRSKTDLFLSFNWLALQGFGGVLAVVQRELVEKSAG